MPTQRSSISAVGVPSFWRPFFSVYVLGGVPVAGHHDFDRADCPDYPLFQRPVEKQGNLAGWLGQSAAVPQKPRGWGFASSATSHSCDFFSGLPAARPSIG